MDAALTADTTPQPRRGRPSKGNRRELKTSLHVRLADEIDADAARAGLSRSDYLARLVQLGYEAAKRDTPRTA